MDIIKKAGFTIVELAIVLFLLSIIAAMIFVPSPGKGLIFNSQLELLVNDLRYTQSLSMSKGERYYLVKTSANGYQIKDSAGVPIALPSGSSTVVLADNISFGAFVNLPNDLISFSSKGVPFVDTTYPGTPLTAAAVIPMIYRGTIKNIFIAPETGSITL